MHFSLGSEDKNKAFRPKRGLLRDIRCARGFPDAHTSAGRVCGLDEFTPLAARHLTSGTLVAVLVIECVVGSRSRKTRSGEYG